MKGRTLQYIILLLLTLSSCLEPKAVPPQVENMIMGHEIWGKVDIILRMAQKREHNGRTYLLAYSEDYNNILPVKQVLSVGRSAGQTGSIIFTSDIQHFTVIKGKDIFYTLEMMYYNQQGELMNHQFCTYEEGKPAYSMLPIHQHFFEVFSRDFDNNIAYPKTLKGEDIKELHYGLNSKGEIKREPDGSLWTLSPNELKKATIDVFQYFYRDTDPTNNMIDEAIIDPKTAKPRIVNFIRQQRSLDSQMPYDRVGLKGYMNFKRANLAFYMKMALVHITIPGHKYISEGYGGLLNFNQRLDNWATTDIILSVPFRVVGDADAKLSDCAKAIASETGKSAEAIQAVLENQEPALIPFELFRI